MENKNLVITETEKGLLTKESIDTLVKARIVPENTPHDQIMVFAVICKEKGLSPFSKEIYLLSHRNGQTGEYTYTPITSIEGFRKMANRGGSLAGCSDAKFDLQPNGSFKTAAQYENGQKPKTCTVSVFKIVQGMRVEFTHTITISEFNTNKQKWATMFFQMATKTAESHAIRKGFGGEVSGVFIDSELGAINDEVGAQVYLEEMDEDNPMWAKAIESIAKGKITLEYVKSRYALSEANEKLLLDQLKERTDGEYKAV